MRRIQIDELIKRVACVTVLTSTSSRAQIDSTSRPDWSDKNGLAPGRKSRRKAVFAFVAF
jgi:hypothetical protein